MRPLLHRGAIVSDKILSAEEVSKIVASPHWSAEGVVRRLEASHEALRAERDACRKRLGEVEEECNDDLRRVQSERDSLKAEQTRLRAGLKLATEKALSMMAERDAAREQACAYEDALREIADCVPNAGRLETQPVGIARAALPNDPVKT